MANQSKAGFMSAIAQGAQGGVQGIEDRPRAQLAKKQAEQQMQQIDYQDEIDAWRVQIDATTKQNQETTRKLQKENMFRGLKYWTVDKNPRHLNALLEGGPMSKSGIVRFSKIDTSADSALINSSGLTEEDLTFVNEQEQEYGGGSRYVKGIMQDGSEKVFDVYKVKQMMGYFKNLTDQEIAEELARNEAKGSDYDPDDPEGLKTGGEWGKKAWVAQRTGVSDPKETISALKRDMEQGNIGGRLEAVEQRTEQLNTKFNGDFLANFDPYDSQQREMAYSDIAAIEKLEGVEFSSSERKEMRDISVLLAMGEPGKEMTADETGIIDSMVTDVKRYITDESGSEAVNAYAAFRNSLRHALYGSALTETEVKSFNEQFGTRRQQLAPLIKQMKTAMMQIQGKLSSITSMQNPYSAKYRIGASQEDADSIVAALGQRIDYLTDLSKGKITEMTPEAQADKDSQIISDVWGTP